MKKLIGIIALSVLLAACAANRTDKHDTNPMNWGNYKCSSQGASGRAYVGWATDESTARSHSLAICQERSNNCQIVDCHNDVVDPEEP
jgi:uncharacterized lipoprotein YajG